MPFWTTFTSNQIDIDVESQLGKDYLSSILQSFTESNVDLIRLDAAGYAIKRAGSNCFMLEETFEFIEELSNRARGMGMQCLVEIYSHYQTQIDIAAHNDMALLAKPMLAATLTVLTCHLRWLRMPLRSQWLKA